MTGVLPPDKRRLVLVEWVDMLGRGGWSPVEDHYREMQAEAYRHSCVGWLIAEDDFALTIAASRADDWRVVADLSGIPRSAIISMCNLETCSDEPYRPERAGQ